MKNNTNESNFTVLGSNANGILSKKDSLLQIIDNLKPVGVIFLQETKVSRMGQVKIPGYEIFEFVRSKTGGGSLLTAAHSSLEPVFIGKTTVIRRLQYCYAYLLPDTYGNSYQSFGSYLIDFLGKLLHLLTKVDHPPILFLIFIYTISTCTLIFVVYFREKNSVLAEQIFNYFKIISEK